MKTPVLPSILIPALATGQPAGAAPVSVTRDDQREVMVTIYNGNLGLVKDLREARLPAGHERGAVHGRGRADRSHDRAPQVAHRRGAGSRSSSRTTSTIC